METPARSSLIPAPRCGAEGHLLPGTGRPIQVCEQLDVRFLLEDLFATIRRFGAVDHHC